MRNPLVNIWDNLDQKEKHDVLNKILKELKFQSSDNTLNSDKKKWYEVYIQNTEYLISQLEKSIK